MKIAPTMGKDKILLVNLSGRGDKDMHTVAKGLGAGALTGSHRGRLREGSRGAPRRAHPVRHGGRSVPRPGGRHHAWAGRGRRRRDRAGRAVLRSHGRWSRHPALVGACAQARRRTARCARLRRGVPRDKDNATPVVLMGYANPIERMGLAAFVAAAPWRRRRRRADRRLPAGGERAAGSRRSQGSGHRPHLPALAHLDRRAHRARREGGAAATSTTSRSRA